MAHYVFVCVPNFPSHKRCLAPKVNRLSFGVLAQGLCEAANWALPRLAEGRGEAGPAHRRPLPKGAPAERGKTPRPLLKGPGGS